MAPVQVIATAMRMSLAHLKTLMLGMMFVGILLWGTTLQAAVPLTWKASGFSIDATNMTLRSVLDEFGRVYGVRIESTANGAQLMRSRLKADTGTEFLDRLGQLGNFRWFVYGETLYIVPSGDNISLRIDVGEDAVQDAKSALVGLGLFDERFGWGELPDTGTVIVSGPRAYVNLARDILLPNDLKEKAESKAKRIMMFRLKYASATDRVINSRGRPETIPGVKTMLTSLLFGSGASPGKLADTPSKFDINSRKPSRTPKVEAGGSRELTKSGSGGSSFVPLFSPPNANASGGSMGAIARNQEASSSGSSGSNGNGGSTSVASTGGDVADTSKDKDERPRIEANPSLNAIMIYDSGNKRAMYAALIAELDVQPQQVEIEALIIDIDRSKIAEMGVEWGVTAGSTSGVVNSTAADSLGAALPVSAATLLISNAARFYARLKALESKGDAHILATPTVLTLDNVAAVLDLSQTAYVSLVGERVADLADITAGTMLRVIPRIIHDGGDTRVHLEVDIEDGSLNNPSTNSASTNVNVTRSTISTQAIIDLQQTLMIGGYHAESLNVNRQKVPLLGDLPYVGGLFRSESKTNSTKERLFLITPRLAGNSLAKASPASRASTRSRAALEKREQDEIREREMEARLLQEQQLQQQFQQQQYQQQFEQPAVTSKYSTSLAMNDVPARMTPAVAAPAAIPASVATPVTSSYSLAAPVATAAPSAPAAAVTTPASVPVRAAVPGSQVTQPVRAVAQPAAPVPTPAPAPAASRALGGMSATLSPAAASASVPSVPATASQASVTSLSESYVAPVTSTNPGSSAPSAASQASAPVASLSAVPLARPSASMTLGGSSAPAATMYPAAGTASEARRPGTRCARPKLALKLGALDLALNP